LPDGGQPSGAAERGQGPDRAVRGCGRHRQQHLGAVRRGRLTVDLPREEEGPAGVGVLIGAACGGGGVLIGIQQRTLLIGEGGGKRGQGVVRLLE
ncbi:putative zinc-binding domain-containing protein, partial [Dysosmobacter welbionis]